MKSGAARTHSVFGAGARPAISRRISPKTDTDGRATIKGTISGEDAFRLYDTFGFPIDLTELMARERGYVVDIAGFEAALDAQRKRSQEERKSKRLGVTADAIDDVGGWELTPGGAGLAGSFVGYDTIEIDTTVTAIRHLADGRVAVMLRESPFYAESGGQISDHGEIVGDGWRVSVDDVRKIDGRPAAIGSIEGDFTFGRALARVPTDRRRDTERNHTATHLLQAALRRVLGESVHQAGSLVSPERLRFDFTHHGPVNPDRLADIEAIVNGIYRSGTGDIDLTFGGQGNAGCANYVTQGGQGGAPSCIELVRAEERFGNGDRIFTLAEQQRVSEASYFGPGNGRGSSNFLGAGRQVRLGLELNF